MRLFKNLFTNTKDDLGILETTNDNLLGDDVVVDATDSDVIENTSDNNEEGFFQKLWNWFTGLFNQDSGSSNLENTDNTSNETSDSPIINGSENLDTPTLSEDEDNSTLLDTDNNTDSVDSSQEENTSERIDTENINNENIEENIVP